MMAQDPSNFLSRWSRRKAEHRDGRGAEKVDGGAEARVGAHAGDSPNEHQGSKAPEPRDEGRADLAATTAGTIDSSEPPHSLPAIEDLTPESDFRPFMRKEVDASTRNAALQRLFSDPQFNRICELNTDIEDFGIFEPIPPAMLRVMDQARSLGFFADEHAAEQSSSNQALNDEAPRAHTTVSDSRPENADQDSAVQHCDGTQAPASLADEEPPEIPGKSATDKASLTSRNDPPAWSAVPESKG
jgi:hypothetical protein